MTKRKSSRPARRTTHIFVDAKLKNQIRIGHPWIYRNAIEHAPKDLPSGTWVRVQSANQQAIGLWDAEGPIAIRLFSAKNIPGASWIKARVQEAWQRRAPLRRPDHHTTAWRWLYGESDGIPGLVVDFYSDAESGKKWAVLKSYSPSLERIQNWVVDALKDITPLNGIINRSDANWKLLAGAPPADEIIIEENGIRFAVDILRGQKTGFFLDQRDNRQTVARWSSGKRVLNLFSYTGGFSVAAALAGASQVTSVDGAPAAIETAKRNFRINNLNPADHGFEIADAFEVLERYHGEGNRFDLIVVDPPSFARSKAQLTNALHAYRKLNALAMRCLVSNGILATSSCTSQVSPTAFNTMLAEAAADARRRFIIQHEAAQPLDHPVAAHFPEGRYLKFVLGEIEVLS